MSIRTLRYAAFGLAIAIPIFTIGCDNSSTEEAGSARVRLLLTDAPFPFDLVSEANVVITDVMLKGSGADSVLLSDGDQSFNLLDLQNGITAPLADLEVAAGTYSQLRIRVSDSAKVILNDASEFDLKIPSGSQSGIKVLLGNIELQDGDLAQITVDFDVEDSFVVQGNPNTPAGIKGFIFKPVIKAKTVVINGEDVPVESE